MSPGRSLFDELTKAILMRALKKNNLGFTLIEFVMAIALTSLIFLTLAQMVIITIRSWDIAQASTDLTDKVDTGFSLMEREIKQIKDQTSLITAQSADIKFVDVYNNTVEYMKSGNQCLCNNNVVMDGVTALSFTYLDKSGNVIASPIVSPQATNVKMVRVNMTVTTSSQTMKLQSLVRLRNMR